jgi:predicted O-methyltransferase YrrM
MNLLLNYIKTLSETTLSTLKESFEHTEGMISFDEAITLYCLAQQVRSGCIVEIGSYRGRSTVFLGLGSLDGAKVQIYAIDPHKNFIGVLGGIFSPKDRTKFYETMLYHHCSEIVALINLSSECITPTWKDPVSLLWIDGDHSYASVKQDFDCWLPHLQNDAIIAFDDATDPNLGPKKLIKELLDTHRFEEIGTIGKIVVIRLVSINA